MAQPKGSCNMAWEMTGKRYDIGIGRVMRGYGEVWRQREESSLERYHPCRRFRYKTVFGDEGSFTVIAG